MAGKDWGRPDAGLVVFTDLDGTLLDHETYAHTPAQEALELLQRERIPLILCSSKTRAEIEFLQAELGLRHPFISENGGGVFLPKGYFSFALEGARAVRDYEVLEFGAPYWQLVETLHRISASVGIRVLGFSDMSADEVMRDCRLSPAAAQRSKLREYDEPFRILETGPAARSRLLGALHAAGLRCTQGGRYYHVTGVTDKGLAVRKLKSLYAQAWEDVMTVGLGDSLNDLALLQEVDVPIVIRNPAAGAAVRLTRKIPTARVSSATGPRGWNEMMVEVLRQRTI